MPKTIDLCKEADIERTCTELLQLDGWRSLRMEATHQTHARRRGESKGVGEPGMADHLYIRYGLALQTEHRKIPAEVMWIEWKRPGGKITEQQELWHSQERGRGAVTLIAGRDFGQEAKTGQEMITAFIVLYRASGLNRGRV